MIPNQDRRNNDAYVTSCNEVTVPPSQPSKSPKETLGKESHLHQSTKQIKMK